MAGRSPMRVAVGMGAALGLFFGLGWGAGGARAADCTAPRAVVNTVVGIRYCADPAFDAVVAAQVQKIRADVRAQRQAGRLIVYASTPISPRGGGQCRAHPPLPPPVKHPPRK